MHQPASLDPDGSSARLIGDPASPDSPAKLTVPCFFLCIFPLHLNSHFQSQHGHSGGYDKITNDVLLTGSVPGSRKGTVADLFSKKEGQGVWIECIIHSTHGLGANRIAGTHQAHLSDKGPLGRGIGLLS